MQNLEELKTVLRYNADTGIFIWYAPGKLYGKRAGTRSPITPVLITWKGEVYKASHLAWYFTYGFMPPMDLKPINGDILDIRIANLTPASTENKSEYLNIGSGDAAVYYDRASNQWVTHLEQDGEVVYISYTSSPEDACRAYLAAYAELNKGVL